MNHLAVINWTTIGGVATPIVTVLTALAKLVTAKLDNISAHLQAQDKRARRSELRMMRVETTLGLKPLPKGDEE